MSSPDTFPNEDKERKQEGEEGSDPDEQRTNKNYDQNDSRTLKADSASSKRNIFEKLKPKAKKIKISKAGSAQSGTSPLRPKAYNKSQMKTYDPSLPHVYDALNLLDELQKLGLKPAGLEMFIRSLHNLAAAAGVSPSVLASIVSEVNSLCKGRDISLVGAQKYIDQLFQQQKALIAAIQDLEKKKNSLEVEMGLKQLEYSTTRDVLSEFGQIRQELERHGISIATDLPKLILLLDTAKQSGFDSSTVIAVLSDIRSQEHKKKDIDDEISNLINSKRTLQEKLLVLEHDVTEKQQIVQAAKELEKLGIGYDELNELQSMVRTIAQTRNSSISAARDVLLSDLRVYYANDKELARKLRVYDSLLEDKREKFSQLVNDYENEKAILDSARQLVSAGFNESWLDRLQAIIDTYGVNLDMLSEELKQSGGLKSRIEELVQTKKVLEEEERLLRQKVVATEDQRLQTLALIKNIIERKSSSHSDNTQDVKIRENVQDLDITNKNDEAGAKVIAEEKDELNELVFALKGQHVNEEKFRIAAQRILEIIYDNFSDSSPTRVILQHALFAFRLEAERKRDDYTSK